MFGSQRPVEAFARASQCSSTLGIAEPYTDAQLLLTAAFLLFLQKNFEFLQLNHEMGLGEDSEASVDGLPSCGVGLPPTPPSGMLLPQGTPSTCAKQVHVK